MKSEVSILSLFGSIDIAFVGSPH